MALQNSVTSLWNSMPSSLPVTRLMPLRRQFRRGDDLSGGERPSNIAVVREGWACRTRTTKDGRRQIIGLLLPGDVFGSSLGASTLADFSVVALSNVIIEGRQPDIEHPEAMLVHAHAEAAIATRWIARLGQRGAIEKITDLVDELVVRQRLGEADDIPAAPFLLTQYDLADATGLTAIHVNRTLRELREANVLHLRRGEVRVPSLRRLRALAHGKEQENERLAGGNILDPLA